MTQVFSFFFFFFFLGGNVTGSTHSLIWWDSVRVGPKPKPERQLAASALDGSSRPRSPSHKVQINTVPLRAALVAPACLPVCLCFWYNSPKHSPFSVLQLERYAEEAEYMCFFLVWETEKDNASFISLIILCFGALVTVFPLVQNPKARNN